LGLNIWQAPQRHEIAPRVNEFLRKLPGPVAIHIPGRDSSRTRVLGNLSHGNEPSGVEAVHGWLQAEQVHAVNVVVILGAVQAALLEPLFFYRQMPGERDFNRCFNPPYLDSQGELAQEVLQYIRELKPEAVVDMHNTSGSSTAFAVTIGDTVEQRKLVSHFVRRMIVTDLRLGSLMEQDFGCPVVTIECGGSADEAADIVARNGIAEFFLRDELYADEPDIEIFRHPLRLELTPHSRIEYAERPLHDRDITVRADIERFNFAPLAISEMLGWLEEDGLSHLRIGSDYHPHLVSDFFKVDEGRLYPTREMRLFMATTRPDIAASDCLFYFVYE